MEPEESSARRGSADQKHSNSPQLLLVPAMSELARLGCRVGVSVFTVDVGWARSLLDFDPGRFL